MTLSEDEGEPSRITAPLGIAKPKDDIADQPQKKEKKKDPTFIVTLDGAESQKKASAGQQKKDAPPTVVASDDASKVMAAFKFKPTNAPSSTPTQVNDNSKKSEVCRIGFNY